MEPDRPHRLPRPVSGFVALSVLGMLGLPTPAESAVGSPSAPIEVSSTARPAIALAAWMDGAARVTVRVESTTGLGSGVLVGSHAVLTAAHVVGDATHVDIVLPDGRHARGPVLSRDLRRDLALVDLVEPADACVPIAGEPAGAGSWVMVAGFVGAAERALSVTTSIGLIVSARDDLLLDAGIVHGMSGGAVLSPAGELLAITHSLDTAAPLRVGDPLLQGASCARSPARSAMSTTTRPESGRATALARLFRARRASASLALSAVQLTRGRVHTRGVAVTREHVLTAVDPRVAASGRCGDVSIDGQRLACAEVRVAGELMLLRFSGGALEPVGPVVSRRPVRGAFLATLDGSGAGVVDGASVAPGRLTPFVMPGRAGPLAILRREQRPIVTLESVLSHDVVAVRGELLVDEAGRPAALHVAEHGPGRGYAIALREALSRFGLAQTGARDRAASARRASPSAVVTGAR